MRASGGTLRPCAEMRRNARHCNSATAVAPLGAPINRLSCCSFARRTGGPLASSEAKEISPLKPMLVITAGLAAFAFGLIPAQSWAVGTANRVWVSGHGVDQAGCGAPAAPCRSLQYAHDNAVVAGGEIDILDPAGYGAVTITKSISIVNDGVGTAGVQASSGNAITINAGPNEAVYLKGLNIDGVQETGANGIVFNSGADLTVTNCVVRHFSSDGIVLQPTSGAIRVLIG